MSYASTVRSWMVFEKEVEPDTDVFDEDIYVPPFQPVYGVVIELKASADTLAYVVYKRISGQDLSTPDIRLLNEGRTIEAGTYHPEGIVVPGDSKINIRVSNRCKVTCIVYLTDPQVAAAVRPIGRGPRIRRPIPEGLPATLVIPANTPAGVKYRIEILPDDPETEQLALRRAEFTVSATPEGDGALKVTPAAEGLDHRVYPLKATYPLQSTSSTEVTDTWDYSNTAPDALYTPRLVVEVEVTKDLTEDRKVTVKVWGMEVR